MNNTAESDTDATLAIKLYGDDKYLLICYLNEIFHTVKVVVYINEFYI